MHNFAIDRCSPSFAETNQLPNESLKNDAGGDLRAVRRNFVKEAAVIKIVVQIAETDLGVDAPGDLAAERAVGLHSDIGAGAKTANVCFTSQIESFAQVVATPDSDIRISPIFGKTKTAIELSLQDPGNSLVRRHRVLPGLSD